MRSLIVGCAAALSMVALTLTCELPHAAELNPAAVTYTLPDTVKWESIPAFPVPSERSWSAIRRSPYSMP